MRQPSRILGYIVVAAFALLLGLRSLWNDRLPTDSFVVLPQKERTDHTIHEVSTTITHQHQAQSDTREIHGLTRKEASANVSLETATITTRVRYKQSNSYVAGASVEILPERPSFMPDGSPRPGYSFVRYSAASTGKLGEAVVTDDSGRAVSIVPAGVRLVLEARAGSVETKVEIESLQQSEWYEHTIWIDNTPDRKFYGRVVVDETKTPITGYDVRLLSGHNADSKIFSRIDWKSDGHFVVDYYSLDSPVLQLSASECAPTVLFLESVESTSDNIHTMTLANAGRLSGAVSRQDSVNTSSLEVILYSEIYGLGHQLGRRWGWRTFTDSGLFAFSELPILTPLGMEIRENGRTLARNLEVIILEPGEKRQVSWCLEPEGHLVGLVRDQNSMPVAYLDVWVVPWSAQAAVRQASVKKNAVFAERQTDENGRFEFQSVPDGKWEIIIPNELAKDMDVVGSSLVVQVPCKEVLMSVFRGLSLSGTISLSGGFPPCSLRVDAISQDSKTVFHAKAQSDGAFVLGPLFPGDYRVSARGICSDVQLISSSVLATAGEEETVHLLVGPAMRISGSTIDELGFCVESRVLVTNDERIICGDLTYQGHFSYGGLPLDCYGLVAIAGCKIGYCSVRGYPTEVPVDMQLVDGSHLGIETKSGVTGSVKVFASGVLVGSGSVAENGKVVKDPMLGNGDMFVVPAGVLQIVFENGLEMSYRFVNIRTGEKLYSSL